MKAIDGSAVCHNCARPSRRRGPARHGGSLRHCGSSRGIAILALGIGAACGGLSASSAQAAQTQISISMNAAPPTPELHTAGPIGGKPQTPFLYTIPATGTAPLTFSATGLPSGLTLASSTGTISGMMPTAGSYPITLTVTNSAGSATGSLTLVSGNTLALLPPMGWNSYDSYGATVTEAQTMAAAQAQLKTLQPHGWGYVVVDYLWFDTTDRRDANGRYLPDLGRFPSATGNLGFQPLADKIHALGLSFGIHVMRGIPRATVSANDPIAGSSYTASQAANQSDPCTWDTHMWGVQGNTAAGQAWYDSVFSQYASWNVDFVKVDDLLYNANQPYRYRQSEVTAIVNAIGKTNRSIVLSLSPGPMATADVASLSTSNMWRMVNDFWDKSGLSTVSDVFNAAGNWQGVSGIGVGHWPDADMLPLGYLGPACPVHASGPTSLTRNEQVSVMSLWSILPSPLIFGGNEPMVQSDAWTLALLTNDEMLAINQDVSGNKAKRIAQSGSTQVWARDLSGGRKAVALFNRGNADATVSVSWSQLGLSGTLNVRDVWKQMDLGPTTGMISQTVPYLGASLMIVSSPNSGPTDAGAESGSIASDAAGPSDATVGGSGSSSGAATSGDGIGATGATGASGSGVSGDQSGSSGSVANSGDDGGAGSGASVGTTGGNSVANTGSGSSGDGTGGSGSTSGSGAPATGSSAGLGSDQAPPPASSGCTLGAVGAASQRSGWDSLFGLAGIALAVGRRRRTS